MRVHELAKREGKTVQEVISLIGDPKITTGLNVVPDDIKLGEEQITELPSNLTPERVRQSIRWQSKASPYYKYRHLI